MSKVTEKAKKRVVKEKVKKEAKPELQEEPKPKVDPVVEHHREIMRMATELIEKCQASDKTNDLAVFLAISCPGVMEKDKDGREVNAMGFTCGKMMNVAELVNGILVRHKDLLKAMRFDAEMDKIMDAFKLDSGKGEIKEVMSATDNEGFKRVLDVIRAVVGSKL